MSGRNIFCSKLPGTFQESVELDFPVAEDVRIWGAAFLIFVKHVVYDPLPVFFAEIHEIERNAHLAGNHFGNKTVLFPLAVSVKSCRCVMPVLHEECEDVVSLLLENPCRNAGVDTAGKPDTNLYIAVICHKMRLF